MLTNTRVGTSHNRFAGCQHQNALETLSPGWQPNLAQVSAVMLKWQTSKWQVKVQISLFTDVCWSHSDVQGPVKHWHAGGGPQSSGCRQLLENKARPAFSSLMLLLWARAFNHQMCRQLFLPPVNGRLKGRGSWGGPSWRLTDLSAHALSCLSLYCRETHTDKTHRKHLWTKY